VARKRKADSGRPEMNHEIRERHEKNLELKIEDWKAETSWREKPQKAQNLP
jgi:hypothetical protein